MLSGVLELRSSGVRRWLDRNLNELRVTCDDLDDSVPDVVFDLGITDKSHNYIDIPKEPLSEFFSQNSDLQNQVIV